MAASIFPPRGAPVIPPTAADRKAAELNIQKAKVQLANRHPFIATLLMHARVTLDDNISTACVNKHGRIRVGTKFATTITIGQMQFLLAHEVMHSALDHFTRRGARDPRAWNIACDKVINDILVKAGLEKIPGGVYQEGARDHYAEELYEAPQDGSGKGQGDPEGGGMSDPGAGEYKPGEGSDDMEDSIGDAADDRETQEKWRVKLAQAKSVAKQFGKMPAGLEKLVDGIINPITPWYELTERFMTRMIKADYSWRRPNKRYIGEGMYLPSYGRQAAMGLIVIQSDESGSISPVELEHFKGHISKIIEVCRPEKVIVLHTDTQVNEHLDEFTLDDLPLEFKAYGGGGTDMCAGIRWVQDQGLDPEVFLTLTDGHTPWPDKDPGFPVLWLCTTDQVAPIGETIRYQVT